jgi:BirA family biotin operon repressor/biotin-[acetyl-CoA-carboxylase] ligase
MVILAPHSMRRFRPDRPRLGRRVRVELPTSELVGTATSITVAGALVVERRPGRPQRGDRVDEVHLRAADGG